MKRRIRIIKKSLTARFCYECEKEKTNNGQIYCDTCCDIIDKRNKDIENTNNNLNSYR